MNNNQSGAVGGCLSMLFVIILITWLVPDDVIIALGVLFIVFIIFAIIYGGYEERYKYFVKIKLKRLDKYYKDVDDSVKSQIGYIEDSAIPQTSIDERIANLQCICKQVKNIKKEDN